MYSNVHFVSVCSNSDDLDLELTFWLTVDMCRPVEISTGYNLHRCKRARVCVCVCSLHATSYTIVTDLFQIGVECGQLCSESCDKLHTTFKSSQKVGL